MRHNKINKNKQTSGNKIYIVPRETFIKQARIAQKQRKKKEHIKTLHKHKNKKHNITQTHTSKQNKYIHHKYQHGKLF